MSMPVERSAGGADDRRLEELAEDGRHGSLDGEGDRGQEHGHPFRKRVGVAHARRRALPASLSLLRAAGALTVGADDCCRESSKREPLRGSLALRISVGVRLVAAAACATSRPTGGSFEKVATATLPREARVFVLAPPSWPQQ